MKRVELNGKNGFDGLKKRPFQCCACRSTKEHRCYKCLCGKCPPNPKKVPPRYGVKDRSSDSHPSREREQGDIKSHIAGDESSKQVSHSHHTQSVSNGEVLTVKESDGNEESMAYTAEHGLSVVLNTPKETRGHNDAGNQKVMTNEDVGGSSKSNAESTSLWDILVAEEPRVSGNQVRWAYKTGSASTWGTSSENKPRGNNGGSGWGTSLSINQEQRDNTAKPEWGNRPRNEPRHEAGSASSWGTSSENKPRGNDVGSGWGTSLSMNREQRDNTAEREWGHCPRNEPRREAGSASTWGTMSENKPRCNNAGSGWGLSMNQEQRDNTAEPDWGNCPGNEPRHEAGSASTWGASSANKTRGNDAGSGWGTSLSMNQEQRDNTAEPEWGHCPRNEPRREAGLASTWGTPSENKPRGTYPGSGWGTSLSMNQDQRDNTAEPEWGNCPRNEPRREAGSASTWGTSSANKPRGNDAGSGWGTSLSLNQDQRDNTAEPELVNRPRNEPTRKAGSASTWGMSSENKPRGIDAGSGWGTSPRDQERKANKAELEWGNWPRNEPRHNAAGPFSSRDDTRVGGQTDIKSHRAGDESSKQVSSNHHAQSGSNWETLTDKKSDENQESMAYTSKHVSSVVVTTPKETRRQDEAGNQKLMTDEDVGGSSELHAKSTSKWDILAAAELGESENQVGWANKAVSASTWGTSSESKPRGNTAGSSWAKEPRRNAPGTFSSRDDSSRGGQRGNKEATYFAQDGSSRRISRSPHMESGSRSPFHVGKRSRDQERTSRRIKDVSSEPVKRPRGDRERTSSRIDDVSSEPVKLQRRRRGNRERTRSRTEDVSSEPVKRPRVDRERTSSRIEAVSSEPVIRTRGSQKIVSTSTEDGSSTSVLVKPNVQSGPLQDRPAEKESRGKQVAMVYKTEDSSRRSPSGSNSRRDAYIVKDPRSNAYGKSSRLYEFCLLRNPEVTTNMAGYGSSKQVLCNHRVPSGSSCGALTVEGLIGNEGVMASRAEVESSDVLPDPYAGCASTLPSLTAKDPKGSSVSINPESVLRAYKKLDPAVASLRHVKPPPVVVSEDDYSRQEQEVYCSPAKDPIWVGNFEVAKLFPFEGTNKIFIAHPAAKIFAKAYGFACNMAGHIKFEMHPRSSFTPKALKSVPDARDIALYFYPQNNVSSMQEYTALLRHLTGYNRMLRSVLGQVELLVFSSKILATNSRKDRGEHFMWGVFHKFWKDEDTCVPKASPT